MQPGPVAATVLPPPSSPPPSPLVNHKRSQTEVLDPRPKKRVRWAPYVSVPPVDPTWVIEDTRTAVQRALVHSLFDDDEDIQLLSHTEVDDDDGDDDGDDAKSRSSRLSRLSDLTELTSSDEEEEERRTAEALLPRSEEDDPPPQVSEDRPAASTSSSKAWRPVSSSSDSREKQIKSLRFKKRVQESPLPGSSRDIVPPPPVLDIQSSPSRRPDNDVGALIRGAIVSCTITSASAFTDHACSRLSVRRMKMSVHKQVHLRLLLAPRLLLDLCLLFGLHRVLVALRRHS